MFNCVSCFWQEDEEGSPDAPQFTMGLCPGNVNVQSMFKVAIISIRFNAFLIYDILNLCWVYRDVSPL